MPACRRQHGSDLRVADRPFPARPIFDLGTRMTVIRPPDGGVALHAPVASVDPDRPALRASRAWAWL